MRIPDETREQLAVKFAVLFPHLDERQRRLLMAAEARGLGHGGVRAAARAAGVSETTVRKGMSDLEAGQCLPGRVRRPGGGRKRIADLDPDLRTALLGLVEPDERGDPMSPLRWTTKSTRTLAAELTRQGHRVGADTVAGLLRQEGFRLQANAKTLEGSQHPDRDAQFRYLNGQARGHRDAGQPVISVDSRLFSHITMNWRGRPLTSHEVILESIAATTTRTGLRVKAELDTNTYPTGIGVGDAEMAALPLTRHVFHGDWNYALHPQPSPAVPAPRSGGLPAPQWDPALLSDPALTGLASHQLQHLIQTLAPHGDTRRGRPPRLTFDDQVLATMLHLHVNLAAEPLAVLFDSSRTAMHRTVLKIRRLLEAQSITISQATTPPALLATLQARVATLSNDPNYKLKTTC
ncbi:ISAzo13 family transposase [Streptomyces sp. NPDC058305]|uniref:ISAzo13 family transposase n=1 Tax=Streptomyces sp. NPDC058305 TaxID=3346438 RepID=UPI0036EA2CA9